LGPALLLLCLLLLGLGVPVAFALGLTTLLYFAFHPDFPLLLMPQKIEGGLESFPLLAVPFFLLTGSLMNHGGATGRLVDLSQALVGHITGGLAHVTVVANMIMSGMSGSATADITSTGAVMIPTMIRSGYPRGFAAAITASASTIGPIVPPSLTLVILGSISGVSIGRLFIGGLIPGLLMGLYLMATSYVIAKRRGYAAVNATFSPVAVVRTLGPALPALLAPLIVVGGILTGVFTPTEAGAIAAAYSLVIGAFVYRELTWAKLPALLREVVVVNAAVMFILGMFSLAGWIFAIEQLPQTLASGFLALTSNPLIFLLIMNVLLLLLGLIVEPLPLVIILGPILIPIAQGYHVDPVQFGIIFTLNICLGLLHPPIGINMFIASYIAKTSIIDFTKEVWPFLVALVLVLLCVTYIPQLVLFLPDHLMGPSH
jgi:C4-dicarboxylate transporter DctM subunit